MINVTIHNIDAFENFLTIVNKFVPQCMIKIGLIDSEIYCINPADFTAVRLLLNTNLITLNENQDLTSITICIRDIMALRSAISVVSQIESDIKSIVLQLDTIINEETSELMVKTIKYSGTAKFKLAAVDIQIIQRYVSSDLSHELKNCWSFDINLKNLDIAQSRTSNIVNMEEISIYLYELNDKVVVDLASRQSPTANSICIPISNSYEGNLKESGFTEVAIHESSFRLFNILKLSNNEKLNCSFNSDYNVFYLVSELSNNEFYIKCRMLVKIIEGN